ncbi:MAG: HAD family hydrolase [Vicinamibacteria bacterium]
MTRYPLAIFDFDGTLVRSDDCITRSLEAALSGRSLPCDVAVARGLIGLPLDRIVRRLGGEHLDDDAVGAVVSAYRGHYAAFEPELVACYPEVPEVLHALHAAGVTLAIATSKTTRGVSATMERLGVAPLFTHVVGNDRVARGKPDPEMVHTILSLAGRAAAEAIVVGDTTFDVEMATAAGVASCAVTYGNHPASRLAEARPTFVVDAPARIVAVFGI